MLLHHMPGPPVATIHTLPAIELDLLRQSPGKVRSTRYCDEVRGADSFTSQNVHSFGFGQGAAAARAIALRIETFGTGHGG
jgi:hypothetical protein